MLNYLDLFSGIGGFALGAYWAGMKFDNHYFSEVEPYAVKLYQERFPDAIPLGDIRSIDCEKLMANAETSGTQPGGGGYTSVSRSGIQTTEGEEREGSQAFDIRHNIDDSGNSCGNGKGADDEKLANTEESRCETRSSNGMGVADGTRRDKGFFEGTDNKKEWIITGGFPCQDISVAGKGAGIGGSRSGLWFEMHRIISGLRPKYVIAENVGALTFRGLDAVLGSLAEIGYDAEWQDIRAEDMGAPHRRERIWIIAYPNSEYGERGAESQFPPGSSWESWDKPIRGSNEIPDPPIEGLERQESAGGDGRESGLFAECGRWWAVEPTVCGVVDGLPDELDAYQGRLAHKSYKRVERLKGLGNAIVPQIAELLFRQIKDDIYAR